MEQTVTHDRYYTHMARLFTSEPKRRTIFRLWIDLLGPVSARANLATILADHALDAHRDVDMQRLATCIIDDIQVNWMGV